MVCFSELRGRLEPRSGPAGPAPRTSVVVSNLSHGEAASPAWEGLSLCYVARGSEHYRVAGRHFRVGAGEMIVTPQALGSEVEIARGTRGGTLGLCLFLAGLQPLGEDSPAPQAPIVIAAGATSLGAELAAQLARLERRAAAGVDAQPFLARARPHVSHLLQQVAAQVDAAPGRRGATRHEAVRKAHLARALLHAVTDRAVPLAELARHAAVSPFQLLRTFRDCFGEPPALYHRKLRLLLAEQAVRTRGLTCEQASTRYGFAGGSSFSHAWRRTFGAGAAKPYFEAA